MGALDKKPGVSSMTLKLREVTRRLNTFINLLKRVEQVWKSVYIYLPFLLFHIYGFFLKYVSQHLMSFFALLLQTSPCSTVPASTASSSLSNRQGVNISQSKTCSLQSSPLHQIAVGLELILEELYRDMLIVNTKFSNLKRAACPVNG